MKIQLEGTLFYLGGAMGSRLDREHFEALMRSRGARLMQTVRHQTQAVVCAPVGSSAYMRAMDMGIPVLDAAAFHTLWTQGEVEVDVLQPGVDASQGLAFNALLPEVRSVLAQPLDASRWSVLMGLMGACDPAQSQPLLAYIHDQMDHQPWSSQMQCVAPQAWVDAMAMGEGSCVHGLTRWLDLHTQTLSSTKVKRMLKTPWLTHVRRLDLPMQPALTKTLFRQLATNPVHAGIHHLSVCKLKPVCVDALNEGSTLRPSSLTLLHVPHLNYQEPWAYLFGSQVCSQVEHVVPSGSDYGALMEILEADDMLPSLTHLEYSGVYTSVHGNDLCALRPDMLARWLGAGRDALKRFTTFTLHTTLVRIPQESSQRGHDFSVLPNLHTLRCMVRASDLLLPDASERVERVLMFDRMHFPDTLTHIQTNVPLDSASLVRLKRHRPDLTVHVVLHP